jgi:hypothetical protein
MGSPAIFKGNRAYLLTEKGLILKSGEVIDNDGPKNYIGYNNFENGATTGWSAFTTTKDSNNHPNGSIGAAGTHTIALTTTNPLSRTRSLQYTTDNSGLQGVISDAFTIDREHIGKVLGVEFAYEIVSGLANGTFAGGTSDTFGVYLYNVTGTSWIVPNGCFPFCSSLPDTAKGITFQTSGDTSHTQYRLAIFTRNAPASSGVVLNLDRFFVGPQVKNSGPLVTKPESFTPVTTITAGASSITGKKWYVGNRGYYQVEIACSGALTLTGSELKINMPTGDVIDTSDFPATPTGVQKVGDADIWDASTENHMGIVHTTSTTQVRVRPFRTFNATTYIANNTDVTATAPFTFASGDKIFVQWSVPIVGRGAYNTVSDGGDTRVVACYGGAVPTGTITGTASIAVFGSVTKDTHGGWNTTTGRYTVQTAGQYSAHCIVDITSTMSVGHRLQVEIYKNGSSYRSSYFRAVATVGSAQAFTEQVFGLVDCVPGDILDFRVLCSGSSNSYNGGSFNIHRLSGPQQIAASEALNLYYTINSSQSIAAAGTTVLFPTKGFNTHDGCFNTSTGVFTAPTTGKYEFACWIRFGSATFTAGQGTGCSIYKNGVAVANIGVWVPYTSTTYGAIQIAGNPIQLHLNAGETAEIKAAHGEGSARSLDGGNPTYSWLSIKKVG